MIQALLRRGKSLLRFYSHFGAGFTVGGAYVAFLLLPYLVRGS